MKKKASLIGITAVLFFMLFTPSILADTRLQDARKVQQQLVTGQLKSERLMDVRKVFKEPVAQVMQKQFITSNTGFINPTYGRFTSKFGWRDIGNGQEFHRGVDIANIIGTNIMAAAGGTVTHSQYMNGYGNVVILRHVMDGKVYATVYAHLSALGVSEGQQVTQGQSVGMMGNTGRSFGSHLHFEIHNGEWNGGRTNAVDPTGFIKL